MRLAFRETAASRLCAQRLLASQLTGLLEQIEEQEDEHLYHTQGWTRELWIKGLGMPAVLPPPEEEKDVKTAIGAARAKQSRRQMLRGKKHGEHSK